MPDHSPVVRETQLLTTRKPCSAGGHARRRTNRQTDRQTDKQTDTDTHTHTHTHTLKPSSGSVLDTGRH